MKQVGGSNANKRQQPTTDFSQPSPKRSKIDNVQEPSNEDTVETLYKLGKPKQSQSTKPKQRMKEVEVPQRQRKASFEEAIAGPQKFVQKKTEKQKPSESTKTEDSNKENQLLKEKNKAEKKAKQRKLELKQQKVIAEKQQKVTKKLEKEVAEKNLKIAELEKARELERQTIDELKKALAEQRPQPAEDTDDDMEDTSKDEDSADVIVISSDDEDEVDSARSTMPSLDFTEDNDIMSNFGIEEGATISSDEADDVSQERSKRLASYTDAGAWVLDPSDPIHDFWS